MTRVGKRGESADVPEYSIHIARCATTRKKRPQSIDPPKFECLHGHLLLKASKHGVMVSTSDYDPYDLISTFGRA